ncbi:30S ribosomal protein S8 [PVC group bacterium (ex Bugula neritina AB1)]|nr:30S ribosomal protein S8 [PVC group bacterium (ex Bugula neritina AB1)]
MSMNDPIADMLTRLRNASVASHKETLIPCSKIKLSIAEILKEHGFITDFSVEEEGVKKTIRVVLKYSATRESALRGIERVSSGSRRVYIPADKVFRVQGGLGISILTTSKGVITDIEARNHGIGGELLCKVW